MKRLTMILSMFMMFAAHAGCDIFTCSKAGILDSVKMFVEQQGVDVNASDEKGFSPLHYASLEGQLPVVEYLISKGSNLEAKGKPGRTPLHLASWNGHQNVVEYLLSKGSNIEAKDKNGNSPLLLAANKGNLGVIESLVESGANVEAKDNKGRTSLHRVTVRGYLDAFNYLLSHGANINATDNFKDTPLHYASFNNMDRLKFIEILLSKGSNIEGKNKMGLTPFLSAAWGRGTKENLQYLISKGANLNARDNQGNTALHLATEPGGLDGFSDIWTVSALRIMYLKKIKFLLSQGFNIEEKNDNGETPLHKAAEEGNFVVLKYLVLNGAQVNPQNNDGKTPLHLATSRGYWGPVTFLISKGADKNIKDKYGKTALDYAISHDDTQILSILREIPVTPLIILETIDPVFNKYCSAVFKENSKVKLDWPSEVINIGKGSKHLTLDDKFGALEILLNYKGRIQKALAKYEDVEMDCPNEREMHIRKTEEVTLLEILVSKSSGDCKIPMGAKVRKGGGTCTNGFCQYSSVESKDCGTNYLGFDEYDITELIIRPVTAPVNPTVYGACTNSGATGIFPPTCIDYYDSESVEAMKNFCDANSEYSKWLDKCPTLESLGGCLHKNSKTVLWFYGSVEGINPKESCQKENNSTWVEDRNAAEELLKAIN